MKKSNALVFVALALICIIFANVFFHKAPELNVDYINDEVLMGTEAIDDILIKKESENFVVCVCSVSQNELMFLVLENDETYSFLFRNSFSLNTLAENATEFKTEKLLLGSISYNLYLNPTEDTVFIEDMTLPVETIEYNQQKIGFWWSENNTN